MIKELPPPITPLDTEAGQFYDEVGKYLIDNDLLYKVDALLVYQAANWWQVYVDAQKEITRTQTMVVTYASGHQQVSPNVTIMTKAQTALNVLFNKLGIGEQARQKLKILEGRPEDDPMDNL